MTQNNINLLMTYVITYMQTDTQENESAYAFNLSERVKKNIIVDAKKKKIRTKNTYNITFFNQKLYV